MEEEIAKDCQPLPSSNGSVLSRIVLRELPQLISKHWFQSTFVRWILPTWENVLNGKTHYSILPVNSNHQDKVFDYIYCTHTSTPPESITSGSRYSKSGFFKIQNLN